MPRRGEHHAVRAGDLSQVRAMLKARPELVNMEMAENDDCSCLEFRCPNVDRGRPAKQPA